MRKIYQSAPDVPQAIANKAIDIIERHLVASGARRVEELSEENKIHLMRELQWYFQSELPAIVIKEGKEQYARKPRGGLLGQARCWLIHILHHSETRA